MKARTREQLQIARVVVMQVRDDDVLDLRAIDAEQAQAVAGLAQQLATATLGRRRIKSGVNDDRMQLVARDPDEVVHAHGTLRAGLRR